MLIGGWKDASISSGGTVSAEVNLEGLFTKVVILTPAALTTSGSTCTMTVGISEESGTTLKAMQSMDADGNGHAAHITGNIAVNQAYVMDIGGAQYVKITLGEAQLAARTFKVRGSM